MTDLQLNSPVTDIAFIGDKYAKKLERLGIKSVQDMLHHYPSRYESYSKADSIANAQNKITEKVRVAGKLTKISNIRTKHGKRLTKGIISDSSGQVPIIWFNQQYITKTLTAGDFVSLSGKIDKFNNQPTLIAPEYEKIKKNKKLIHTADLVPIYPETAGLSSKWLRSRLNAIINKYQVLNLVAEHLPPELIKAHKLVSIKQALKQIHFPKNKEEIAEAKKRLGFEELLILQLKNLIQRKKWEKQTPTYTIEIKKHKEKLEKLIRSLDFELTTAQKKCLNEIFNDLKKDQPMNRLLQGDVGAGKTVVAAIAMYTVHLNKKQSVLMAPTEILAEQHHKEIKKITDHLNVPVKLLTGSRKLSKNNLPENSIIIGTHALLYNKELLNRVGLMVIDEQQRFGVKQRSELIQKKDTTPHTLTMTATPIPRSLALTIYGNLDISTIDEMPPGRKPVKTWVVTPEKHTNAYKWVSDQIEKASNNAENKKRRQAFVVFPLIEESDHETLHDIKAATSEYEKLKKTIFAELEIGLLHGQMKPEQKEIIVNKFRKGKLDILISTPVVEVGVDIPNATIIVIEGAERFGLASLHQLRGRVGRGNQQAYCLLMANKKYGNSYRRLKAMEKINSGFELAELDLKIRGPGEIHGTKQHGTIELKIASLNNQILIQQTRTAAEKLLQNGLENYPGLRDKLENRIEEPVEPN